MTGAGVRRSGGAALAAVTATSNSAVASMNFGIWCMCLSNDFATIASTIYAFEWSVRRKLPSVGRKHPCPERVVGIDLTKRSVQLMGVYAGGSCFRRNLFQSSARTCQASLPVAALAIQAFALPRKSFRSTLHNASAGPLSVMTMVSVVSKPQPSIHRPGMK